MHWLPLVAMVIASALPFPHDPASRIVAATTTSTAPGNDNINNNIIDDNNNLHQSASASLHHASSSSDYNSHDPTDYKSMQTDYNMADKEPQNQKDFITSSSNEVDDRGVYELNLVNSLEVPPTEGAPTWTRDVLEGQKDSKTYENSLDFNTKNDIQDSVSAVSPASQMQSPDLTKERTMETQAGFVEENSGLNFGLDGLLEGGDMFLDAHPRVLFSRSASPPEDPPLQLMLESGLLEEEEDHKEWDARTEGHGDRASGNENAGHKRDKRSHSFDGRWVQRSVCESENVWVINKTAAFDSSGKMVSILPEIQTQTGPIKQYFYETRCRRAENPPGGRHEETGVAGASCLGIDKKQWKSKCIAKQSYVRALTKDTNNRVGWRWIRIDSSCVCVLLSRTNKAQAREVLTGRG